MEDKNTIKQLALNAYFGAVDSKFSKEQAGEALRKALVEVTGTETITPRVFRKHAPVIFELIEETLDRIIPDLVEGQFDVFAETKSYQFGDKPVFTSDDTSLFTAAIISEGNNNLRRQRLYTGRSSFTFETQWIGVKIYEDFYRFMTGRTDWPALVRKVAESYAEFLRLHVYNTFIATYSTINAPWKQAGTPTVDNLSELIQHVETAAKRSAVIVGTKAALAKVPVKFQTEKSSDTFNQIGHYGMFQSTDMVELKQGYKMDTTTWALDDKKLLILPVGGVKPVKILLEGEAQIRETSNPQENADENIEYLFRKKGGVGVLQSVQYGIFDIA